MYADPEILWKSFMKGKILCSYLDTHEPQDLKYMLKLA